MAIRVALVAAVLTAAGVLLFNRTEPVAPQPAPAVIEPIAVVIAPVDAGVEDLTPPDAGDVRFADGFCAEGGEQFRVKFTLTLHAQLSPNAPNAPRWFHEGVAQSFEPEPEPRAWSLMARNRTWIPFSSLEGSFSAFEASKDAGLAYAQSYAMVELMRELGGAQAIADARQAFSEGADTPTVLAKVCRRAEVTGADLLDFLGRRTSAGK